MTENLRGRITEFRKKIIREEEETLAEARISMAKDVDRLHKWFGTMDPDIQNSFLNAIAEDRDLATVDGEWRFKWRRNSDISISAELLAVRNQGLRVDTNVVLFNKWRLPVTAGRYTDMPYGEEITINCSPFDPNNISQPEIIQFEDKQTKVCVEDQEYALVG